MSGDLVVSVVIATHDRPDRLRELIASLRAQSLDRSAFEIVVVDDGSGPETQELLRREAEVAEGPSLRLIRRDRSGGPAVARNDGWRAARAPLVAFTDDDCVADSSWLSTAVAAAADSPGTIMQGETRPRDSELPGAGPFHRTLSTRGPGPYFETCNIFYPRELLVRLNGFDGESFSICGEDTDLGWRSIESGAGAIYCPEARIEHAVDHLGLMGKLRLAARWTEAVQCVARYPGYRRAHLWRGVFWRPSHYVLLRALASLALPKQLRLFQLVVLSKYIRYLIERARDEGGGPRLAPYILLHDTVETYSILKGALRYRTLVI